MRCDLHVHTLHSGMCNVPFLSAVCRESYNEPGELYRELKRRGMSLVTVTDHDSIDAAEQLRHHEDFFLSEEVTCGLPSGSNIHIGVYDLNDRQHIEVQRRRADFHALIAYLQENNLFFTANHLFSSVTGHRVAGDFEVIQEAFDAVETLNGCMLKITNEAAAQYARRHCKMGVGGSDAHTLRSAASCWTEVPGARNKEEFLAGLRAGYGRARGTDGSYLRLTRDILQIGLSMVRSSPALAVLAPLGGLAPVITFINYIREKQFARLWKERYEAEYALRKFAAGVAA